MVPEAKPWRRAFFDEAALPDAVFGPVDFEVTGCGAICVFSLRFQCSTVDID